MGDVYEIQVQGNFCAAHALIGYEGDCSKIHGHNWEISAFIECRTLDDIGMGIDFRDAKSAVNDILDSMDHTNLNDLDAFTTVNPTAENIARILYTRLKSRLNSPHVRVARIQVFESPGCGVTYREEE